MTTRLHVRTATPYDVVIGPGVTAELPGLLDGVARVAVIHPPCLRDRAETIRAGLARDALEVHLIEVPEGEAAKTAEVLTFCWEVLGRASFTRSDAVVGYGGGSTTDLAGFVAASWLRGIRYITIPTTVLGMVDAAVGGKTGINTAAGKNLVGAFHEPAAVLCDLNAVASLPPSEITSGMAEVAKCGFIADPSILELVEGATLNGQAADERLLADLITKGVAVKVATVERDLRETSSGAGGAIGREALNYGHTLGHALERVSGYTTRHGEAISVGMVFAAELAHRTGSIDADLLARHRGVLGALGLPTTTDVDFQSLLAAMRVDKKARGNTLRFVVLEGLANPAILTGPDESLLQAAHAALAP